MTNSGGSNGHGADAEARVRRELMFVCTRDLDDVEYDGKVISLKAGLDRVGGDHELYERFPAHFKPVERGQHGQRCGVEHRMVDGASLRYPARTSQRASSRELPTPARMTLEQELRVRREALAELDRHAREHAAPDAADTFWQGVSQLLGTAQQEIEDKAAMELYDALDGARVESLEQEREDLGRWLDEQ
jgi:hypothetical protein